MERLEWRNLGSCSLDDCLWQYTLSSTRYGTVVKNIVFEPCYRKSPIPWSQTCSRPLLWWFLWLKKYGSQSLTPQLVTKAKQIDIHKVLSTMTLTQEPVSKSSLLPLCSFMLFLFILPDFVDFTHLADFSIESQGHIFPPCLNWNMRLQKSSTMSRINYHSFSALRICKTVLE